MAHKLSILGIAFLFNLTAHGAAKIALETIITDGLSDPTHAAFAPGDNETLYIVQQPGLIHQFRNGKLLEKPFLDIQSKVATGGEMGLLSIAFHPNYAKNGRYFVDYDIRADKKTGNPPSDIWTVISEFSSKGVEKEILRIQQMPYSNHKGGQLAFDRKGLLYIGMGDGGSAGDPHSNGQNKNVLLAKILRIDIDHVDQVRQTPYSIPKDNPFAKGGGLPEIFAYGLRNPWRFSFDKKTDALFVGDVGQNIWEEIDRVESGKNYGWNIMEAKHCFKPKGDACDASGLTLPIWEYRHDGSTNCIIGGYVYRGKRFPELQGAYIYADYGSGKIWALHLDETQRHAVSNEELMDSGYPITSFGQEASGELVAVSYDGRVFRVVKPKT